MPRNESNLKALNSYITYNTYKAVFFEKCLEFQQCQFYRQTRQNPAIKSDHCSKKLVTSSLSGVASRFFIIFFCFRWI